MAGTGLLRDSPNEYGNNYNAPPSKEESSSYSGLFGSAGALAAMDRLAFGADAVEEVEGAARRLGLPEEGDTDLYTGDGDTDTDLSDMESVASFASEASDLNDDEKKIKKKKQKAIKRSWFTITLGPADELEEDSSEDENDAKAEEEAKLASGKGGGWKTRLQAAGLGETNIEALADSGVESLREIGFLNDVEFEMLGFSLDDIAITRSAVANAANADAAARPITDWRVFLTAANLKEYIPILEDRGIVNYHELSLITDQEYMKLTRTGMTSQEVKALRAVLADADEIGSAAQRNRPPPKQQPQSAVPSTLPASLTSQFSFLGGSFNNATGGVLGSSTSFLPQSFDAGNTFGLTGTFDAGGKTTNKQNQGDIGGEGGDDSESDIASQLRNLSPDQGAALLEDMSLPAQAKLLAHLSPAQAALLIQDMKTDAATKGGLLLKLPNRVRGLVVVEVKPSLRVAILESINTSDTYRLLLSLDSEEGERYKTLSLLRTETASAFLSKLSAVERSRIMDGMPLHEQTACLALLNEEDRGDSLRALPLEIQVALLEDMNDEDRAASLSFVDPSVMAMMMTDMNHHDREAALSHMTHKEISTMLAAGMKALSKIEITAVERLDMDDLSSRNNRLEDMISETNRAIAKLQESGQDNNKDRMWSAIRRDAKAAAAAQRDLCLSLQNRALGRSDAKDLNPPKDVVEQLTLAGRRSGAIRLLLHELPFIDPSATTDTEHKHLNHGLDTSISLNEASQDDLLRELGVRLGAGEDVMLTVERLALAAGFTKKGTSIDIFSGSTNSRASNSNKDARFSIRVDGLSPNKFDGVAQQELESALMKGYGLKDSGSTKVTVVGMYVSGPLAGGTATGSCEGGSSLVVDINVVNFKTSKACTKFVSAARDMAVPLSKTDYGDVSFEKPPVICQDESLHIAGVPKAPTIVSVSPGDGEANVLVVPPSMGASLDSSVLEIEVVANPGNLRAFAHVGEPVVVKGLANGTRYRFVAHVRNAAGWSEFSAPSAPLIPGDLTAPPMPPEIAAVSTAGKDFEVTVLVAPAGKFFLRPCTLVEVKSEPDGKSAFAPPDVPILMEGLRPGVEYRFRARAKNMNGWSKSSKASAPISFTAYTDMAAMVGKAVFGDQMPMGYEEDNVEELDEAAKQAILDHNLEKDLLRKGKSPLEVLLHKQRFKRNSMNDATNVDLSEAEAKAVAELTPEELQLLEQQRKKEHSNKSFTVKEEVNMGHDVFALQMKDIPGLPPNDNKFIRRFVGLMSTKGMAVFRHGTRSRKKTVIKLDPAGMTLFWDANKMTDDNSIDLTYEAKEVTRGQVFSWFRSISLDSELCVSVVCVAEGKKKPKTLDMECLSKDDATLLYAALSVLNHARQPDDLAKEAEAE